MLSLTTHFREQWKKRVSPHVPSAKEVERMIDEAVQIQKFRACFTPRGRRIEFPALYWLPDDDIVFKVHEKNKKVLTVLAPRVLDPD